MTEEPRPTGPDPDHPEYEVAERVGRTLGRFTRAARAAARTAQPGVQREAERLAQQAKAAAETARPHVQRAAGNAAERAAQFLQDHDEEIKRAASTGARIVAYRSTPAYLRPIVSAATEEFIRPAPRRDPRHEAAAEDLLRSQAESDEQPDSP
jgi:hypothetical protein